MYTVFLNKKVPSVYNVSWLPIVDIKTPHINSSIFQDIIDGIIIYKRNGGVIPNIRNFSFHDLVFRYRGITIGIFGIIRGGLRERLKQDTSLLRCLEGKFKYDWIRQSFLPTFNPKFNELIDLNVKKVHNVYKVFKRSSFRGMSYTLPEEYNMTMDCTFTVSKIITPTLTPTIVIHGQPILGSDEYTMDELIESITSKFITFNITIEFQ